MSIISNTRALSVADILRNRIFNGELAQGAHLMEVSLATELGVSRTPVRDAMARLADEGLLIYHPNRGFLVRRFDIKDIYDAFTLRASLEALACRLIGERGLPAPGQERLRHILEEQRRVLETEEWTNEEAMAWHDMNLDFHGVLLELAANQWLTDAVRRARQLPPVFDIRSRPHNLQSLRLQYQRKHTWQSLQDHLRIVEALTQHQFSRAERLMEEHILTNRDVLVRALQTSVAADEESTAVVQSDKSGGLKKQRDPDQLKKTASQE